MAANRPFPDLVVLPADSIVVDRRTATEVARLWPFVIRQCRTDGYRLSAMQEQFLEATNALAAGVPLAEALRPADGKPGKADSGRSDFVAYVTSTEAAAIADVTPRTVRNWVAQRHVRSVRVGGQLLVDPDSLGEHLARRDAA
jgi:excisionase family DNA binding protein